MDINNQDAGAPFALVGAGGARGVAAGTGDNTESLGAIVDMQLQNGLMSGFAFCAGSATLADTKSISLVEFKLEHGDAANLSDAADLVVKAFTDIVVSDGGTTEQFAVKFGVDLTGVKRYWRLTATPDLDAASTDTFELGFGFAAIGDESPVADGAD
jgi:hypothetical protein